MGELKVSNYTAPREDPLLHPGKRPDSSYVMDGNNNVFLIRDMDRGLTHAFIETPEGHVSVNDFLKRNNAAALEKRIPVVGFGTNPCPGQLEYKFKPINNLIVPVIKGSIRGFDTVYKFISVPGYAYAQLIPAEDVSVEAWITLLDQEQYERLNWSERVLINKPDYRVGIFPHFETEYSGKLKALAYVGNTKFLLSPECKGQTETPISIAEIPAKGRKNPALTQEEMLNHGLEIFYLEDFLRGYLIKNDDGKVDYSGSLGRRLAAYLNKHFKLHDDGAFECDRCATLLSHINELAESCHNKQLAMSEIPEIKRTLLADPNQSPFLFGDVFR